MDFDLIPSLSDSIKTIGDFVAVIAAGKVNVGTMLILAAVAFIGFRTVRRVGLVAVSLLGLFRGLPLSSMPVAAVLLIGGMTTMGYGETSCREAKEKNVNSRTKDRVPLTSEDLLAIADSAAKASTIGEHNFMRSRAILDETLSYARSQRPIDDESSGAPLARANPYQGLPLWFLGGGMCLVSLGMVIRRVAITWPSSSD